jgi:hypothetical protein
MTDSLVMPDQFVLDYPANEPYWSETSWFSLSIPERGINGWLYYHFRPNMNCMLAGPALWDGHGQKAWQFIAFDWQQMRVLPLGRYGIDYNKYDFSTPWGMTVKTIEPMQRYQLHYQRDHLLLDLEWTAIAPANLKQGTTPQQQAGSYRLHFEQPGRMTGHLVVDGQQYDVDCYAMRDGGHGSRFMESVKPGGYAWAIADERTAWHVLAPNSGEGPSHNIREGFLLRDGQSAPLVSGQRIVIERQGPRPVVTEISARDALGRELHARGVSIASAELMLFPDRGQWWSLYDWSFDGGSASGEDQEYYGIQEFRRWHREDPTQWPLR